VTDSQHKQVYGGAGIAAAVSMQWAMVSVEIIIFKSNNQPVRDSNQNHSTAEQVATMSDHSGNIKNADNNQPG